MLSGSLDGNLNETIVNIFNESKSRASQVPAAAVIPARWMLDNIIAFKTLVVGIVCFIYMIIIRYNCILSKWFILSYIKINLPWVIEHASSGFFFYAFIIQHGINITDFGFCYGWFKSKSWLIRIVGGRLYFDLRGEIFGQSKDNLQQKHPSMIFLFIKSDSWGIEDD